MEGFREDMKTILHKSEDRGYANHGWLQANHSFSFAGFHNPQKVNFGALRVLNDDIIEPKMGFGTHPHDNMEIITIPLKGVLKHRDNMGDTWIPVVPGEVQVMSAGTGVQHSEINGSDSEYLSLFQIWIFPDTQNVAPRYDQKSFDSAARHNQLQTLVTSMNNSHEGSLKVHQDVLLSRIDLDADKNYEYKLKSENHGVYVMNITGETIINSHELNSRDAIGVSETESFNIRAHQDSHLLLIEVPMVF